jgi:peptide/nickel transport system substrate-binding protein
MRPLHRTALAATALVVATSVALAGCSGGPDETRGGPDATVRVGLVLEPTSPW